LFLDLLACTYTDMLFELFTYLATPSPRYVRRMGYLYESIAMRERYRRCGSHWKDHLEHSRIAVLEAAGACRDHGAAVILGSGLLLDVPLAELSDIFQEVVLVDIVHLPQVLKYARRFANVRLVPYDVSTIAAALFEKSRSGGSTLPEPAIADFRLVEATAMVVSLNILSQLAVQPCQYALAHMPGLKENDLQAWCRRIIASHHAALMALPCEACLIADYAYTKHGRRGDLLEGGSTIHGFQLPEPVAGWIWRIAPLGEQSPHYARELSVGVWRICPSAVR